MPVSQEVVDFIKHSVIERFLTQTKTKASGLRRESPVAKFVRDTNSSSVAFCEEARHLAERYRKTLRSRTALVVISRFTCDGNRHIGLFQLREAAVIALLAESQNLNVIRRAFRKYEKAFVIPSLVPDFGVSTYQSSHSDYFEDFAGVERPLTPEELLADLITSEQPRSLSELVELVGKDPSLSTAKVKVELNNATIKLRLDEVIRNLARADGSIVLVRESHDASLKVSNRKRVPVDSGGLHDILVLLREKGLVR